LAAITVVGSTTPDPIGLELVASYTPVPGSCAATSDTGSWQNFAEQSLAQATDGSFGAQVDFPTTEFGLGPGTYLICVWIEHFSDNSQLLGSTQLTVRPPHASLTPSPAVVDPNKLGFHLTVTYGLEVGPGQVTVAADDAPGPQPCPADPDSPIGGFFGFCSRVLGQGGPLSGSAVANAVGITGIVVSGRWRICGYVPDDYGEVVAAVTTNVMVSKHKSTGAGRCKVPNLRGKPLARAERALIAARCAVGRITRKKRAGKRRGTVLSQSARPGQSLPRGSAIGLVVAK
jgi:hypothetical protein